MFAMVPVTNLSSEPPNQRSAPDAGFPLCCYLGRPWPHAAEPPSLGRAASSVGAALCIVHKPNCYGLKPRRDGIWQFGGSHAAPMELEPAIVGAVTINMSLLRSLKSAAPVRDMGNTRLRITVQPQLLRSRHDQTIRCITNASELRS